MCSFHLPSSVNWWKMSGVCSEALCRLFGHYGLRIVRVANMLGMHHPRPGMRFSSHLLLFSSRLAGDYGVDVALRSIDLPKPWRHPLCNTSRTNWGKIIQTSQSCLLFTLKLLMIQDKNVAIKVLAMKWAKCDQNPKEIGETGTATM